MTHRVLAVVLVVLVAVPLTAQVREEVGDGAGVPPGLVDPGAPLWSPQRAVFFDNGPLVTHPGGGAGGADDSRVQNTSLSMTTLGFANQGASGNRMADDFTIPAGQSWTIQTITFFAYQTGSTTTSPISAANLQIWNGPPDNAGSSVVWGDLVTDRMVSSAWTNIYRSSETSPAGTLRPVMAVVVGVNATFPEGTYWVDYMPFGSASYSGPWAPPVTILGQTVTGNAKQYFSSAWQEATDGGTGAAQGLPFIIEGANARAGIPAVSGSGVAVLVLLLSVAAVLLIRRRLA